jgi:hypothetical protein
MAPTWGATFRKEKPRPVCAERGSAGQNAGSRSDRSPLLRRLIWLNHTNYIGQREIRDHAMDTLGDRSRR